MLYYLRANLSIFKEGQERKEIKQKETDGLLKEGGRDTFINAVREKKTMGSDTSSFFCLVLGKTPKKLASICCP
jgi:hypothetical protein